MNDGGPAFPFYKGDAIRGYVEPHGLTSYNIENPGMTLRDYFAAQTLNASMLSLDTDIRKNISRDPSPASVARVCYAVADAMLAERAK